MRCFIAIDLSNELKDRIISLQKTMPGDIKLVEPENLHFTLKFLGEIDEDAIKEITERLSKLAGETKPFTISLNSIGVFPNLSYIRVIWIGSTSEEFINLHKSVVKILENIGKPEKEAIPHLTIARVRSARNKETIARIIKRYEKEPFGSMTVDKIKLKKSTLTPRGPIYEDIRVFELGA